MSMLQDSFFGEQVSVLIRGGKVLLETSGELVFDEVDIQIANGVIENIGKDLQPSGAYTVEDASGHYIIPGLINAHAHSYSAISRNTVRGYPLEPWALYVTADTLNRGSRVGFVSAAIGAIEMIRSGVTTVLDQLGGSEESIAGAVEAYQEIGMRAAVAPMITDKPVHDTYAAQDLGFPAELLNRLNEIPVLNHTELLGMTENLIKKYNVDGARVRIFVGPHGPQKCTDELLSGATELAEKYDIGFHTHLLESPTQAYGQQSLVGGSIVEHLNTLGVLSKRFSGAHSVWLTANDVKLLGQSDATLVNNAYSNLYLGSGFAAYRLWQEAGVNQAHGTDGANCGGNQSLMESIRLSTGLQHMSLNDPSQWRTQAESLRRSYQGGAHALQLDDQIGAIAPGRRADLVFVDSSREQFVSPIGEVDTLVETMNQSHVKHVMIDGVVVLRDGKILGINEKELLKEAREIATETMSHNADLREIAEMQKPHLLKLHAMALSKFNPRHGNLS